MTRRDLAELAAHLDSIRRYDRADRLDHILFANTLPGTQPSMQLLPGEMTMMRGPAGQAIVDADPGDDEPDQKQVRERPRRKSGPRRPGVSVGVDVILDSRDEAVGPGSR